MKKKVLIALPNQGWIHASVVMSLVRIMNDPRYDKVLLVPPPNRFTSIEATRQYIHHYFLEDKFDYLLSIDDDNAPLKNPLDLIEFDKDLIGCVTPTWYYAKDTPIENPIRLNAYDRIENKELKKFQFIEHTPKKGLQKVDAIGMGCYLLARRVLEDEMVQNTPIHSISRDDGRTFKGEDILFCELLTSRGFEIYAHYDYPCMHYKEIDLVDIREGFEKYYK